MQVSKIGEIAKVFSGYPFRGAVEPFPVGAVSVLQARDIVPGEVLREIGPLVKILEVPPRRDFYLQEGDVVFVSRAVGAGSFKATVFKSQSQNVIASNTLLILRPDTERLSPDFLCLFLNSAQGQVLLAGCAVGSSIKGVSPTVLRETKISIPSLDKQKLLVSLHENIREQMKISARQNEIRQNIINASIRILTV